MGVINNPNEAGVACGYQDSVVYLEGRYSSESLPNFLSSYFKTSFFADSAFLGVPLEFEINFHFITNVQWNFGDPSSGAANTSILINPTHTFSTAGNYTVTLIAQNGVKSDTVIKTITVKDVPQIDLGPDRDLCLTNPDSVKLSLGGEKGVYQWSTGSADSTTFVKPADVSSSSVENRLLVLLQFTNQCGTDTDTVLVYGSEPLTVSLGADATLCSDDFTVVPTIDTLTPIVQLLWQDSSINSFFTTIRESEIEQTKTIKFTATNACGTANDSMRVTFLSVPDGILPNDSIHCLDEGFYLVRPNRTGITYLWDDQTTDFQRYVSGTGTFGLISCNQCDTLRDTFNIIFNGEPRAEFIDDTLVCPNETVVISNLQHQVGQTYVWSAGWLSGVEDWWLSGVEATDSVLSLSGAEMTALFDPGTSAPLSGLPLSVRVTLRECSILDSIVLQLRGDCYDGCTPAFANIFTPNADGLNDRFSSGLNCETEHYHLSIYSRWGALVFESRHPNIAWDGSINGIPAHNGVYYYVLSYQPKGEAQRAYRGYVELVE
jgi:gliding motility-associated-like protein